MEVGIVEVVKNQIENILNLRVKDYQIYLHLDSISNKLAEVKQMNHNFRKIFNLYTHSQFKALLNNLKTIELQRLPIKLDK
jgi:UDP-N-acetyl-D-mannosaminuronic acid transferase (WecB/TagA/CpsF family)